jgi:hypothetical protein
MFALLAAIVAALGPPAQAQPSMQFPPRSSIPPPPEPSGPPPLTPADMANYCVYENRVYSLGSGLCIGRTPYVCVPSPGPSTGNRAYWASKEDQVFLRPACN